MQLVSISKKLEKIKKEQQACMHSMRRMKAKTKTKTNLSSLLLISSLPLQGLQGDLLS